MRKTIAWLFMALWCCWTEVSAATDYVANVYGRQSVSLNGKWAAIIDPYDAGGRIPLYKNPKPTSKEQFYEFSFEGGLRLNVPSDWNSQTPELKYYEGTIWYARHFDYHRMTDERAVLYFAGVSNRCTVYLNGQKVTTHEGAFTPFQADVTTLLKDGTNFLCVEVNNTRRKEAIPAMSFDWWNYGGITRDVMLVRVPEVYIGDYVVQLDKHEADVVDVRVELSQAIADQPVHVVIPELKQQWHMKTDAMGVARTRVKVKGLKRWSPEVPKLYEVKLSSGRDNVQDKIGFRNIEVKGTRICLNGRETFLRSVSFHEEIPQRMGRAYSEGDAQMLLAEAKELGVNMVRLAHYQQNEYIVRLAEKMGIMLWQEIPVWQAIDFSNQETLKKASDMLRETIRRDRNRCADCFWGIANETQNTPARNAFLRELLRVGKEMDTTRLFVAAYDLASYNPTADRFLMDDDFYQNLDMIGINKYMGWYAAWPKAPEQLFWEVAKDKPLFISEFGCEALYGQHGDKEVASSWSEEYQAELYRRNLTMFENIENLCGVSPWILYDFRSPTRMHPTNQDGWNRKGLVSDQGQRKQAWYIMRDYYARKAQTPFAKPQQSTVGKTEGTPLYKDAHASVAARVEDLLGRMTTEEKIMQLVQFTLGRNNIENNKGREVLNIPPEVGSLIYFGTDPILRNKMQHTAMEQSRLGIPVLFAHDVIHGFRTIFPIPLAQACSFNELLAEQSCRVAAQESRMSGVDWTFSPMIDVARDPRWGRVAEGYGEDPYLNGIMGAAAVRGYQGESLSDSLSIAACLKHYVAYGASEAGRDYVYTEVSQQTLWDTYLVPYRMAMKEHPATVMSSFNNLSGTPVTMNRYVLQDVLRDKLGFQGFVVSDWAAIAQMKGQGAVDNLKKAGELALCAGVDMDMMSHAYDEHLKQSLEEGTVDISVIDTAVRRILTLKFELGLFENPYTPEPMDDSRFLRADSRKVAEQLAAESMVLLKNDGTLLPLKGKTLAVVGPLAQAQEDLLGCWMGHGEKEQVTSIWQAVQKEFGQQVIGYARGCDYEGDDTSGFHEAEQLVERADVVVVCLGEKRRWSGENTSRSTIELPQIQTDFLRAIHAKGKKVVLVLSNGRPLQLNHMEPLADAIIEMWQPGTPGGTPLAAILSGRVNPSGKLAITFPYTTGQIPIYYNQRPSARHHQGFYQDIQSTPLYAFGHGLSYSTFSYGPIVVSKKVLKADEDFTVSVAVSNTGCVDGQETVLGFVSCPYAMLTRPVKELRFVAKKMIPMGQVVDYTFQLNTTRDLGFVDQNGNCVLEPGKYVVTIGDQQVELTIE